MTVTDINHNSHFENLGKTPYVIPSGADYGCLDMIILGEKCPNFMHSKTFWVFTYPNMFLPSFVDIKHIYIPDFTIPVNLLLNNDQ